MPTTYAHFRLGESVAEALPASIHETVCNHKELFQIGVHGPDIFFYHNPLLKNNIVCLGQRMHHEAGASFFIPAASVIHKNAEKEAHKAYLYGFLCHFAMDVTCHGYIAEQIEKTGISHFEIEAEYDRELLERDGYEAVSKCLTGHLKPTYKNAAVISDFWSEVNPKQVAQTIKRQIFFLNLLRAPSRIKRNILLALMKLSGQYDTLHGLIINYRENAACRETTAWLMEHYDKAVQLAVDLITEYENYLQTGGKLSETFFYDFESEKHTQKKQKI